MAKDLATIKSTVKMLEADMKRVNQAKSLFITAAEHGFTATSTRNIMDFIGEERIDSDRRLKQALADDLLRSELMLVFLRKQASSSDVAGDITKKLFSTPYRASRIWIRGIKR